MGIQANEPGANFLNYYTPGYVPTFNYHTDEIRGRPVGQIYNTIANGVRSMPSYAKQISVLDRWAIVAYVKALQRSQHARSEDVPAGAEGRE